MTSQSKSPGRAWLLGMTKGDVESCEEPGGWPEFEITLRFYVSSDNPAVIEAERERVWLALPDVLMEASDDD